jgi:hypothetical protein
MAKLFSISELSSSASQEPQKDVSAKQAETFLRIHSEKLETLKELLGRLPEENEIFFIWTLKSFNAFTFIPYLIKHAGIIDEMVITSYSINKRIVNALVKLIDSGKIKSVTLLLSDTMKFRMPAVVDLLQSLITHREDFKVYYSWNHSKVSLCRVQDQHFVIEGSGNWGENARHEQYIFMNSKKIFHFRKTYIDNEIHSGTD